MALRNVLLATAALFVSTAAFAADAEKTPAVDAKAPVAAEAAKTDAKATHKTGKHHGKHHGAKKVEETKTEEAK